MSYKQKGLSHIYLLNYSMNISLQTFLASFMFDILVCLFYISVVIVIIITARKLTTIYESKKLLNTLLASAEKNNSEVQCLLGFKYSHGEDCAVDMKKATYWYGKAAELGLTTAQYKYAQLCKPYYLDKDDEDECYKLAFYWHSKAANKGHAGSQYQLGMIYANGFGVTKDFNSSFKWFERSAEQFFLEALYQTAASYLNGDGVKKNTKQGIFYLQAYIKHAECTDDKKAMIERIIGDIYLDRVEYEGWEVNLKNTEDLYSAVKWYFRSANRNLPDSYAAQGKLASLCYIDDCIPHSYHTKLKLACWFQKTAESGGCYSQYYIGMMHYKGNGVPKNYVLAYIWFSISNLQKSINLVEIIEAKLAPADISMAQVLIKKCFSQCSSDNTSYKIKPSIYLDGEYEKMYITQRSSLFQ